MPSLGIKTRFAPAPSGVIHLGNIRAALINLIFAKKQHGHFILRIEDTDKEKVSYEKITAVLEDLKWLGIDFDEGPGKNGKYKPYFQSERTSLYNEYLNSLISKNYAYRCFCSKERLEELRQKQIDLKLPPRYDRLCLNLSQGEISNKIANYQPFVWRFLINQDWSIKIVDFIRGPILFSMHNFSDFVISRSDGSFNFLFANFVDDVTMEISHVIRGEDHLSNGALQACLYKVFNIEIPIFLHLPLILDEDGQKLSKRSQNFDLHFLKETGILPEAICCYLASLGSNLEDKPLSIQEMIQQYDLHSISSQSVRYETKKILSLNKKWINRLTSEELLVRMQNLYDAAINLSLDTGLSKIIDTCKTHSETLQELLATIESIIHAPKITDIIIETAKALKTDALISAIKILKNNNIAEAQGLETVIAQTDVSKKHLYSFIRLACTGKLHGLTINELYQLLPTKELSKRISALNDRI